MCTHCGNPRCIDGEICVKGLFSAQGAKFEPRSAGLHKDTKKESVQYQFESEHVFPMAATSRLFPGANANDEPTMSISYAVHRGGVGGAGGGVSSTGSSGTAKQWADHLVDLAQKKGFPAALRAAVIDEANAHKVNGAFTSEVAAQLCRVVDGHVAKGRLTEDEAGPIKNEVVDYQKKQG